MDVVTSSSPPAIIDVGLLTVKGPDYHSNRRLAAAARVKGITLGLIDPRQVSPAIIDGRLCVRGPGGIIAPGVILPRQGSQISNSSLAVLSHLQAMGIPVVNNTQSILVARNKFLTTQVLASAGIKVPASVFVNSVEGFLDAVECLGGYPVVCKKTIGRKGREVFLVKGMPQALEILETHLLPAEGLMLQQFIPPKGRRDFRILVIGGRMASAMELFAANGDFRANFSISGNSRGTDPSPEMEETAIRCARAVGLDIAGVDIMMSDKNGMLAIEANYAPGFKGLEAATGIDIAGRIIEYALLVKKERLRNACESRISD